jgi:hypothetical protein
MKTAYEFMANASFILAGVVCAVAAGAVVCTVVCAAVCAICRGIKGRHK